MWCGEDMANKALTFIGAKLNQMQPSLAGDGTTLVGLMVSLSVTYRDMVGGQTVVGTTESVDAWAQLSAQQKINMQDIRDTIVAYITSTYTA
jgi:hypothetical protein